MTPARYREIRAIFESVADLGTDEQAAALLEVGTRDQELASEVQALLAAHQRSGSFIESPAVVFASAMFGEPERSAGPYHLLDRIGQGGMGEVWRAEQTTPLSRTVAVKLIKAGMDTQEVISRFESERQSLARMEHPAIAQVFDAGTTADGRPYFAMEYVSGVPINEYCDTRRLPLRDRLKLFVRVCEGVQHAHQRAVIHRDLKPSNILVTEIDGKPAPKIIDFGVARAIARDDPDSTVLTRIGAILGTPDYMSPEQASTGPADIDTRADVYSLGVVLYELLTGCLPLVLRGLPLAEVLRRISEGGAPSPSARVRALEPGSKAAEPRRSTRAAIIAELRGDLDAITLKALECDRRMRYDSPAELAADIGRHLRHEPVVARQANLGYRARKYLRRHKMAATAAVVVLAAAISFGVWQAVELRRITRERDRADRITQFMTKMFRISDPGESRGNQVTARQILDRASADIGSGLASDPELQAQLMNVMGRVYLNLGLLPEAESLLRRSVETRRRVLGPEHLDTVQSMNDLGNALSAMDRRAEVEQIDRQVLAIRQRRLGASHPDTLKSMNNLAVDMVHDDRYREAAQLQRAVLDAERRQLGPENASTLLAMTNLGDTLSRVGQFREAESLKREAMEIRRRTLGVDHPDTLHATSQLATTLYDEGRYAEAETLDREVLAQSRRILGPEHRNTLNAMIALANPLENEGRLAEAEQLDREALKVQRRTLGEEHYDVLLAMNNLAGILAAEGRYAEAERLDREVVAVRTRLRGPEHPHTLISRDRLALVLAMEGKFEEAEQIARRTRESQRKAVGAQHPDTGSTTYTLACITAHTGTAAEALALLREALSSGLKPNAALGIDKDPLLKPLHADPGFAELVSYARARTEGVVSASRSEHVQ